MMMIVIMFQIPGFILFYLNLLPTTSLPLGNLKERLILISDLLLDHLIGMGLTGVGRDVILTPTTDILQVVVIQQIQVVIPIVIGKMFIPS